MILRVYEKPGCFDYLDDDMMYFNFYRDDVLYMNLAIQIYGKVSSIHIDYKMWNHNILKQTKRDWEYLKKNLVHFGVKRVIASYPDADDLKWKRFIKHFGFAEPKKILISEQEI